MKRGTEHVAGDGIGMDFCSFGSQGHEEGLSPFDAESLLGRVMKMAENISDEQVQQAQEMYDALKANTEGIIAILESVQDRQSADAAAQQWNAAQIRQLELFGKALEGGYHGAFLRFAAQADQDVALHGNGRINAQLVRLHEVNPPYYGSQALRSTLTGEPES